MKPIKVFVITDRRGRPVRDIYSLLPEMHAKLKDARLECRLWDRNCPKDAPHTPVRATIAADRENERE